VHTYQSLHVLVQVIKEHGRFMRFSFDGTTRNGEAFAICARFVSQTFDIFTRAISFKTLRSSMAGDEIAAAVTQTMMPGGNMEGIGVAPRHVVAFNRDRASPNDVACREYLCRVVFPGARDMPCVPHGLNVVGTKAEYSKLTVFMGHLNQVFRSPEVWLTAACVCVAGACPARL